MYSCVRTHLFGGISAESALSHANCAAGSDSVKHSKRAVPPRLTFSDVDLIVRSCESAEINQKSNMNFYGKYL